MNQMNNYFKRAGNLGMEESTRLFKPAGNLETKEPNSYLMPGGDLGTEKLNTNPEQIENSIKEESNDYISWGDDSELIEAGSMIVSRKRYEEIVAAGNEIQELQVLGPDLISIRYEKRGRGRR